jgi:HSP20 family molecular chaperone IbpA
MEFANDKNMWRGFLKQIDLMNTLNGGVSMASLNMKEAEDSLTITVSAPGVSPEAFNIFIDHYKLIIFSTLQDNNSDEDDFEKSDMDVPMHVPMFYKSFDIPYFVDGNKIDAVYEEGVLKVVLPYRQKRTTLQRKIDIKNL